MNGLFINASPRIVRSATYAMLKSLESGFVALGDHSSEFINLKNIKFNGCIGCYKCWDKTPGKCILPDEVDSIISDKLIKSDYIFFGTPLYDYNMTGLLKDFIERLLPISEPWLVVNKGNIASTCHPHVYKKFNPKIILVSPCGFPEFHHFEGLLSSFRQFCNQHGWEIIEEILRPGAEPLSRKELRSLCGRYLSYLYDAGSELGEFGSISLKTKSKLLLDMMPGGKEKFIKNSKIYWVTRMEKYMHE